MRCSSFFSCFPAEIDTVYPILADSVGENCVTSSLQITLVAVVADPKAATGGSETGSAGKEKMWENDLRKEGRGIRRGVSKELWKSTAFPVLQGTWKGLASPWVCTARRGITWCWQNYLDISTKITGGAVRGGE